MNLSKFEYIRLSVIDRCNLRCIYCNPDGNNGKDRGDRTITPEDISELLRFFVRLNTRKVRITGGEPLMRDDIGEIIGVVSRFREIEDLALTTNGVLLLEKLDSIVNSQIKRVNVSLPSLDSSRYREITRGRIDRVIEAIKVLLKTQIRVKINMVAYGDEALEELKRCIDFISDKDVELRFIEYMPVCSSTYHHDKFISAERIERLLVDVYGFSPQESKTHTVSRIYTRPDLLGRIGLIMPVSNQFCDSCNKVRINCYGELRPCLFSGKKINILEIVKRSPFEQALERLLNFMNLNFTRPDIKSILSGENVSSVRMVETGG